MVLLGVQLSFAILPDGNTASLGSETAVPLTVLLTVVLVNAMNFVDGLDGLAAGVAAIAALAEFAYSYHISVTNGLYRATPATLLAVATAGVCVGLPAAQLQPGAPLHGRLRLDADRPAARRDGDFGHRRGLVRGHRRAPTGCRR